MSLDVSEADLVRIYYSIAGNLRVVGLLVFLVHVPECARLLPRSRDVFPPDNMSGLDCLRHGVQ